MPSFDIVSKVDLQLLDNTLNNVKKELQNRYDFKDNPFEIEFQKKENLIKIEAESEMKLKQIEDIIISKGLKQQIDPKAFRFDQEIIPSGKIVYKKIPIQNGLGQPEAKKIIKIIKDQGFKVQSAIMDDIIRVSAKKIDELQEVIQFLKSTPLEFPLQYINFKS